MIEGLPAPAGPLRVGGLPAVARRGRTAARGCGLVLLAVFWSACAARPLGAHETIDAERANALIAATEEAAAAAKTTARGPGEAQFALGSALVEATDALNRDLAAHSGKLTFNAEHLEKALAQRDLAPHLDAAIGRYRLPRAPLAEALRVSPGAPYALRARFALLKAGFYESFVLDPFELVGMGFDDLERQIAEAEALAAVLASPDDAEEAAFIHAIDLARASRLASRPEAMRAYAERARTALGSFAQAYPESMRAATAGLVLKGLGAK